MSTEPEEADPENPEKEIEIDRFPEGTFGDIRERPSEVEGDEPVADDKAIKDTARIEVHKGSVKSGSKRAAPRY